ncbi:MAG: hypothetical protein JW827_06710 [Spirochaetes bacterium]|nr:hypothetical protein [Spirochaetota bacterium]
MNLKVINKKNIQTKEELSEKNKKLFIMKWDKLVPPDFFIISEYIYIHLDLSIQYNEKIKTDKIIMIGECNENFWFFKIINRSKDPLFQFMAKKPSDDIISTIKVIIVDWYGVINSLKINNTELEYAVGKFL